MSIRKRGKRYQVTYRVSGEATPRTETFKSEDEALIRDAQIRLAKQNGTFEPPVRQAKGKIAPKKDITVKEFMDEYVEVYGLKKWGNSFYTANLGLIKNYITPYIGDHYVRSITTRDMDAYYTMLLERPAVIVSGHHDTGAKISAHTIQNPQATEKCLWEGGSLGVYFGQPDPRRYFARATQQGTCRVVR